MWTDPETGEQRGGIAEVRYTHAECIRLLVLNPFMRQGELAKHFGVTDGWMSQVMRSDAFRAKLAEAKLEVYGPALQTLRDRYEELAEATLAKIQDRINGPAAMPTDKFLIEAAKLSTAALGYGARAPGDNDRGPSVQFIVNLPGKARSEEDWASRHTPGGSASGEIIELGTPESR